MSNAPKSQYVHPELDSHTKGVWKTFECDLLCTLITHGHSMIAGKYAGEDSQGRAQLDLQTPEELVERSFRTVELVMQGLEQRGWIAPPCSAERVIELSPIYSAQRRVMDGYGFSRSELIDRIVKDVLGETEPA